MERDAERQAFAKAATYLNYYPTAKWTALVAGAASALVYVGLLSVLWMFADLMVSRGRLPDSHDLTSPQQRKFIDDWSALEPEVQKGAA